MVMINETNNKHFSAADPVGYLYELEEIKSIVPRVLEEITRFANNDGKIPGLSTGIPDLDRVIMKLRKMDLVIIGSRPGMGKTSFALSIALNVVTTTNKTVALFLLKNSREQLILSAIAAESFIARGKLKTGNMEPEEWRLLADTVTALSNMNFWINDNASITTSDIAEQCKRISNLGLIIVDDIHLMQPGEIDREFAQYEKKGYSEEISYMMKMIAKELSVPVICLSKISTACLERDNKHPLLSDFREFGAIDKFADIVIGIHRDYYYSMDPIMENFAQCIILRNRRGDTGLVTLQWLPEYARFLPLDRYHSD